MAQRKASADHTQIEYAQGVLARNPFTAWIAEQAGRFSWQMDGDNIVISPLPAHEHTALNEGDENHVRDKENIFPISVTKEGKIRIPSLGLEDYPDEKGRERFKRMPRQETDAVAFLCNRFYKSTGHSCIYLHSLKHPELDRIFDIDGGISASGQWSVSAASYKQTRFRQVTNPLDRGVNTFMGFPISDEQARVLQADAFLTLTNPEFRVHIVNAGKHNYNCALFTMSHLQGIGLPIDHLTGKNHTRKLGKKVADYLFTRPALPHRDIKQLLHGQTLQSVPIRDPKNPKETYQMLLGTTEHGELIGQMTGDNILTDHRSNKHRYIAFDIGAIAEQCVGTLLKQDGTFRDPTKYPVAPMSMTPVNTKCQLWMGPSF